ncbi:MAG: xanthine dehydrogenase [Clostridia bacterium]|nr:xanthine dehydrogenase [Clostridia bacterium]
MIPFDFEYYKPCSYEEAIGAFMELEAAGKSPVYYGGGSELISMARLGNLSFGAVIDLKEIPECRVLGFDTDQLLLGSALTLSDIIESKIFPLMEKSAGRIADHTMQCKITLGGNIASTILYRETVLPLLLCDSCLTIASPQGLYRLPFCQVFHGRLQLQKGEFIVNVATSKSFLQMPYYHMKKTANEKIDYPLLTIAGVKVGGALRIAFSGLKAYPFRDARVEIILNDPALDFAQRARKIGAVLSADILEDLRGSSAYRQYVLQNTIENVLVTMKDIS